MATIELSRARPGMVLGADVLDKRGRLLVPRGIELKEKHLNAFPAWGIDRIEIEGEGDASSALEPWACEAAEREVASLFERANTSHPAMAALRDACARRLAVRIQARGLTGSEA